MLSTSKEPPAGDQLNASPVCDSPSIRGPKKRRWLRRSIACGLILAVLYVFREPLLRLPADAVVVEDPLTPTDGLVVLDGDLCCDHAVRLFHAGYAPRLLLIESRPRRLQRLGILLSDTELARRRLRKREVPDDALVVLPGQAFNHWDAVRLLGDWLSRHPGLRITLLCDRFGSRRLSHILHRVLADDVSRVQLRPLKPLRYDQTNWWRTGEGVKAITTAYLRLGYAWFYGEESEEARCEFDLAEYETNLR